MDTEAALKALPLSIKVGAYDWSIGIEYEDAHDELRGQAIFDNLTIMLWAKNLTSPVHVVGILLHELLHVIFDNEKLGKLRKDKEEREEQIILGFEAGLVSLFRDNPKLLRWVAKCLK